jgi:hypothetical protein
MKRNVSVGEFVRRQTPESRFSHFDGTWDELVELVETCFGQAKPGYRKGVVLVTLPAGRFFSGVVEVTPQIELCAKFTARRPGEAAAIVVTAAGEKLPAKVVDVVLYHRDVLKESGEPLPKTDWEIISINARPTEEEEPMNPVAMARNFLGLPGGTKADYSPEEFAKAIVYWSTRAMRA